MIPLTTAPEKPPWGEPCNGCGYCCAAELCPVGRAVHGEDHPAPCPSMKFRDGRFWCEAVTVAESISPEHGAFIRFRLGIGVGCDSRDPEAQ
jgi:hypothetical protein